MGQVAIDSTHKPLQIQGTEREKNPQAGISVPEHSSGFTVWTQAVFTCADTLVPLGDGTYLKRQLLDASRTLKKKKPSGVEAPPSLLFSVGQVKSLSLPHICAILTRSLSNEA